uniref:Uncharacterized protein n=1 Tax=Anguilla anguilla TaxID=7936 RepID=A0A0E9WR19_ANGAN
MQVASSFIVMPGSLPGRPGGASPKAERRRSLACRQSSPGLWWHIPPLAA